MKFADSSYWIALINPLDRLHHAAVQISSSGQISQVLTSELVFVEVLNHYSSFGQRLRKAAARVVNDLLSDRSVQVEPLSSSRFKAALALYSRRVDKSWSLTDCASLLSIQERGISEVLTEDSHFRQMGLKVLLRDE